MFFIRAKIPFAFFIYFGLLGATAVFDDELSAASFHLKILDTDGRLLPCRVHLKDGGGSAIQAPGLPFWRDHFVCPGEVELDLPPGNYRYLIERGPEFQRVEGDRELAENNSSQLTAKLARIAELRQEGWFTADLHVHRDPREVELLMLAEDLDFAPVITWWNNRNYWSTRAHPAETLKRFDGHRLYDVMAGEDEREGGALLYFGLHRPLDIRATTREFPSPLEYVADARRADPAVWVDIEKPFWWDVPVWIASEVADSIGIANNHMCHSTMLANEAWGKPRDTERLPDPLGNGYWSQEIYYHLLNAGIRLPPSAGSASGVLPNPVGYNRVYVSVDGKFTAEKFWSALKDGRSFVTNGPLLICRASGELPGHTFRVNETNATIDLAVSLTSKDPISRVEVIKNGEIVRTLQPEPAESQRLETSLHLNSGGWFLIRAFTENSETFRFASTAPYFVEFKDQPRYVSRNSVDFFLAWTREREKRVRANISDRDQLASVLPYHLSAIEFWERLLREANAE